MENEIKSENAQSFTETNVKRNGSVFIEQPDYILKEGKAHQILKIILKRELLNITSMAQYLELAEEIAKAL